MSMTYYFISDLHIGGDEALGVCDYEDELIEFLEKLAAPGEDAELLIIGDIFGMWEFTDMEGPEKLKALKVTVRCVPLDGEDEEGRCIFTGRPSKRRGLFAKAY